MQRIQKQRELLSNDKEYDMTASIEQIISNAFDIIAPSWPLKHLIAVNPLKGFETISFNQALATSATLYQNRHLPDAFHNINIQTIKWCQAYFDEGQATIELPLKTRGFYACFRKMVLYDNQLIQSKQAASFIKYLPGDAAQAVAVCLTRLGISKADSDDFMRFLLTSLPGWASYVCYSTRWKHINCNAQRSISIDYMAVRMIITYLLWPSTVAIQNCYKKQNVPLLTYNPLKTLEDNESRYQSWLLSQIMETARDTKADISSPKAQLVFCIDVRSEPMRRAIESLDSYATFGYAGFFGLPVSIRNDFSSNTYASCPVLLKPKHIIKERVNLDEIKKSNLLNKLRKIDLTKQLYQSLKYTFTTPFTLVEGLGLWCGLWMLFRTICPSVATYFHRKLINTDFENTLVNPVQDENNHIAGMTFTDQCQYAESFLRMTGLTKQFSRLVILCAHGAVTENNAFQSALDCGACGGHNGSPNARLLAAILNNASVRETLAIKDIFIPESTKFIAGMHNTTTDEITLYSHNKQDINPEIVQLKKDLAAATILTNQERLKKFPSTKFNRHLLKERSIDWAETRPEWGLATNAAMIIGPRELTKQINLHGRCFLHSYDWTIDPEGELLTTIMTAPMIVAQWINYQYLFSTLDNVAYGSGSKITHNIAGKIGVMQGNASDLMHGLPLQSVYSGDHTPYHEIMRLTTVIHAPRSRIKSIINSQPSVCKLIKNAWIHLICVDPEDYLIYRMNCDLSWENVNV